MGRILRGSDLMLFITVNNKPTSIAFATSHKLSLSGETVETSTKDSSGKWASKQVNKISWNVTTENLYSLDGAGINFPSLFTLMTKMEEIDVVFALEAGYKASRCRPRWRLDAGGNAVQREGDYDVAGAERTGWPKRDFHGFV
jgi:hypothetical protein